MELGLEANKKVNFNDIDANDWYAESLAAAVENGQIQGRPDGSFGPHDSISREEAMAIISRVLKKLGIKPSTDEKAIDKFIDKDSISPWAKEYVVSLVGLGIINGSGDRINPKEEITRAEICVILDKIMSDFMDR